MSQNVQRGRKKGIINLIFERNYIAKKADFINLLFDVGQETLGDQH